MISLSDLINVFLIYKTGVIDRPGCPRARVGSAHPQPATPALCRLPSSITSQSVGTNRILCGIRIAVCSQSVSPRYLQTERFTALGTGKEVRPRRYETGCEEDIRIDWSACIKLECIFWVRWLVRPLASHCAADAFATPAALKAGLACPRQPTLLCHTDPMRCLKP